jgi:magnesium chelatase subunit I
VGLAAAALEFAMEGLYLNKRLAKDSDGARTVYGA